MYDDGAIVGLGKGLMMIGSEDVRLVFVLLGCQTEIYNQLFCSSDAQVGVDESYLLLH